MLRSSVLVGIGFGAGTAAVVALLRAAEGESLAPALVVGVVAPALAPLVLLGAGALRVVGITLYLPHAQRRVARNADRAATAAGPRGGGARR